MTSTDKGLEKGHLALTQTVQSEIVLELSVLMLTIQPGPKVCPCQPILKIWDGQHTFLFTDGDTSIIKMKQVS